MMPQAIIDNQLTDRQTCPPSDRASFMRLFTSKRYVRLWMLGWAVAVETRARYNYKQLVCQQRSLFISFGIIKRLVLFINNSLSDSALSSLLSSERYAKL